MRESKNVAMAFLLGTFLTGGVLGFSANKIMRRDQVCTTRGVNPVVEMMATRLRLDTEQSAAINAILDNRSAQYRKAMAQIRPQMDSIKADAREQMRRVMTQEQKQEFEAMLRELSDSTNKDSDR
jgi:polyhydroxyalkanoate synthesis regulator protein